MTDIISFFQEQEQSGIASPGRANFLETALVVFKCATPQQFQTVVKFVKKVKSKSVDTDFSPLSDNPFMYMKDRSSCSECVALANT